MRFIPRSIALLLVAAAVVEAQVPERGRGGAPRRSAQRDSGRGGAGVVAVRQAIERAIRNQVQPTEDQMRRLRAIDQRFEGQRSKLTSDELAVRRELRQAMLDTANINQAHIGQLLDRMIAFPARRAALMEEEQRALADVLTPLQRAKYHAIQENLRRRIIEQGRGGPPPGAPPGRPPRG